MGAGGEPYLLGHQPVSALYALLVLGMGAYYEEPVAIALGVFYLIIIALEKKK